VAAITKTIDFLRVEPERPLEDAREVRLAENILSSYTRAEDLLAEALQNAADAIDERSVLSNNAPRRIEIVLDKKKKAFSVTDTGTGMRPRELEVVLAPNVSYKSGPLSKRPEGRSRGEKGVGLTFLVFACNQFVLETSNGEVRQRAVVKNANRWIQTEGSTARPMAKVTRFDDLKSELDSDCYTTVTLSGIDEATFGLDLFEKSDEELIWLLRTRTAVGNTTYVFEDLGRDPEPAIDVTLVVIDEEGNRGKRLEVPYRYALPEELIDEAIIVDWEEINALGPAEQRAALTGRALRHRERYARSADRFVDCYFLVVDGRQMATALELLTAKEQFAPGEWQGLWLATRGMPANVALSDDIIKPRAYARRTFALIQYDGLKLDLGRKTVAGRVSQMLTEVAEEAWGDISDAAERVQQGTDEGVGQALLEQRRKRALAARALGGPIPYQKVPANAVGVMGIFHELISTTDGPLPQMYTLRSGVFGKQDELVYLAPPNGIPAAHVLFGYSVKEISDQLQRDERLMETAELAVVWDLGSDPGIELAELGDDEHGFTHELLLYKAIDKLPLIVLREVLERAESPAR
jgi:Histidine kinase-, DNA gyrase B-, and HSP90-like ATPase